MDLDRVGTLGHSRGGGGVIAQALDSHTPPSGVHVRATMALAPAMNGINADKERITRVPLAVVAGTCDAMREDGKVAATMASGDSDAEHHDVPGGNHNFFNTIWTPGIGPAFATDDVAVEKRNRPGGRGESTNGTAPSGSSSPPSSARPRSTTRPRSSTST
ncbi:hypothetical protein [Nonomuraea sp. NPDC049684]|uniref:hypothetical protein n=1 Tax=Nonomuraea sp. NPDC049684 TaxID=3364356 RepID=UPI0037AAD3A1